MMTIGSTGANDTRDQQRPASARRLEIINSDRALVPLTPPSRPSASYRRSIPSTFFAHLLATRDLAPQTRDRRRAEPAEAVSAYRAVNTLRRETGNQITRQI
jgi:hypothetical protein